MQKQDGDFLHIDHKMYTCKDWRKGKNILTTQLYIHDHPHNKIDFLFQSMSLVEQRINSMKLIPATDKNTAEFQTFVKIVV